MTRTEPGGSYRSLERLIAPGIALPARASVAHLYGVVLVRDLGRGLVLPGRDRTHIG